MRADKTLHLLLVSLALFACVPRMEPQDSRPPLTVTPGETLLLVAAPALGAQAPMKLVGTNDGVETWMSADRYAISLRAGVLVATRGFGFDLMGSDGQITGDALSSGAEPSYERHLRYLTTDNLSIWLNAECSMRIADRAQAASRHEETCKTPIGGYTNSFWVGSQHVVLRSRQWVSAEVGYLDIRYIGD